MGCAADVAGLGAGRLRMDYDGATTQIALRRSDRFRHLPFGLLRRPAPRWREHVRVEGVLGG